MTGETAIASTGAAEPVVLLGASSQRKVVLASADAGLRGRLRTSLNGMRWEVHEAAGGAEAIGGAGTAADEGGVGGDGAIGLSCAAPSSR